MTGKSAKTSNNHLIYFLILWIFFSAVKADDQRNYIVELINTECFHNTSVIQTFTCSVRNENNVRKLDMRLVLSTTIPEFQLRMVLYMLRPKMPRMQLYDLTVNICDFLTTVNKHKIFSILLRTFKRHVNGVPTCPLKKDFNYTLTGFKFDAKDYPTYLPDGEFTGINYALYQNELVAKVILRGRVTKKK